MDKKDKERIGNVNNLIRSGRRTTYDRQSTDFRGSFPRVLAIFRADFPSGDGLAQGFRAYLPRLFERFCRPTESFALISPEVIGVSPSLPLAEICVLNPFAPISPREAHHQNLARVDFRAYFPRP